ncbi:Ig-like domain-containing protein [Catenuloplanes japonicus]|uniref:Ig-like domain-containing protein n=1 Tax=Catenuloplanes japonicus TaxID=33876 RepID=UPI0005250A18|nr:Ig-like domain-containing protein [Catenuloplanes japonicus]
MRRVASAAVALLLTGGLLTVPASAAQAKKGGDRSGPRLTVTSYALESNTLTVKVSAKDPSGVKGVSLIVRGRVVATDTTAPFELVADLSAYKGDVRWKVRAVDRRGNGRDSDERKSKPRGDRPKPSPSPSTAPSSSPSALPVPSSSPVESEHPSPEHSEDD